MQQPLPQPITIYHTSLTRDKLPVFPALEPMNIGLETTVSSSTADQNNVALMPKFWGDLADEEIDHSLEKDLTLQLVKNTTQKDISIVPIHSEAALRSVDITRKTALKVSNDMLL